MVDTHINGKMIEEKLKNGFELLKKKQYDPAISLFEELVRQDGYQAKYGLATALFRKKSDTNILDHDSIDQIIDLYQESLMEKPDFADAYLMLGHAYMKKAFILLRKYQEIHSEELAKQALECLDRAEIDFKEAMKYEKKYTKTAEENLESIDRNRTTIKGFMEKYSCQLN